MRETMITTRQGEYTFLPQEHILFGAGSIQHLADEVQKYKRTKALLITGKTLATKTNVIQQVLQALGTTSAEVFHEIGEHAPMAAIKRATELARETHIDLLISVGGGSPIDATKVIAYSLDEGHRQFLPHIAIPTTLSAAEFAKDAGYTDEAQNRKKGVSDPGLVPRSVILDAELTLATPLRLWISSGIRSLDHAVETLYAPGIHPINDVLALEAIRKLFAYLPRSQAHPEDVEIRTELQLAAWMSFFGSTNTPMGLSHVLGRSMGATYHVAHGITSCITLPVVMKAMVESHAAQLSRIAQVLQLPGDDQATQAMHAAIAVDDLIARLGLPRHLREVGIGPDDLHSIAIYAVGGQGEKAEFAEKLLQQML